MTEQVAELSSSLESSQHSCRTMKAELKDLKSREARLMTDLGELEDDNVALQKQLMQAKQTQVDTSHSLKYYVRLLDNQFKDLLMKLCFGLVVYSILH